MFGWKKSIRQYHYYDSGNAYSFCGVSLYAKTDFKKLGFLTDAEITAAGLIICLNCYLQDEPKLTITALIRYAREWW